jgi:hypothetical protein
VENPDVMESQGIDPKAKRTNPWILFGSVLVVALLIGAAFVAGRLLQKPVNADEGNLVVMGDGGPRIVQKSFDVEKPEELPDRAPDVTGMMQKVENNSIFVGSTSGPVGIMIKKEGDQVDVGVEGDTGPTVEVVVTKETLMFKDVTTLSMVHGDTPPDKVKQEIAPATLDELEGQALIVAWGERKGDRLIAEVVLCNIIPELGE